MSETDNTATSTTPAKRSRKWIWAALAVGGLGIASAGLVQAQGWERGGGWRGDGMGRGHGMRHDERGMRMARFCRAEIERYAPVARAWVKADLRLDTGQSTQFDALADILVPGLETLKRDVCADLAKTGAPAPERMKALATNLRKAADLAERAVVPTEQFYGSLNADQKARVDSLAERRMHRRMGGMGGMGGMGRMGDDSDARPQRP